MPTREEELLAKQERVYGVLDVATKPAQWFIGGLQLLALFGVAIIVTVGTPFYFWFNGQEVTLGMWYNAGLGLLALITFLAAPAYFLFAGLGCLLFMGLYGDNPVHREQIVAMNPRILLLAFFLVGLTQAFIRWRIRRKKQKEEERRNRPKYRVLAGDDPYPDTWW